MSDKNTPLSKSDIIDDVITKKIDYLIGMNAPFDKKGLTAFVLTPEEFSLENMVMGDVFEMMNKLREMGIVNVQYDPASETISGECCLYQIKLNDAQLAQLATHHDMRSP